MWVERIEIGGFGRLRNLSIDLQDGLNVVSGLNEAGKSTLHQAIATALFGCFSSTDRRKEQDAERRRERFAPWDGGPYRVSIVTRNAGGAALRIDWDLSGRTSFVARDAITGEDRTSAIRGVGDGVLRTDTHGISRAVFERSLVVRQGELAAIADEEGAVAAALESALASSERNASASRAVEILAAQRDSIGTARSSKRPLPSRGPRRTTPPRRSGRPRRREPRSRAPRSRRGLPLARRRRPRAGSPARARRRADGAWPRSSSGWSASQRSRRDCTSSSASAPRSPTPPRSSPPRSSSSRTRETHAPPRPIAPSGRAARPTPSSPRSPRPRRACARSTPRWRCTRPTAAARTAPRCASSTPSSPACGPDPRASR